MGGGGNLTPTFESGGMAPFPRLSRASVIEMSEVSESCAVHRGRLGVDSH